MALFLARGVSFRQAGILRDAVLIEVPLACIGYVAVELMNRSPLAALFVLAPIVLIYQAFMLPKMQDEAMRALESVNRDLTDANQVDPAAQRRAVPDAGQGLRRARPVRGRPRGSGGGLCRGDCRGAGAAGRSEWR